MAICFLRDGRSLPHYRRNMPFSCFLKGEEEKEIEKKTAAYLRHGRAWHLLTRRVFRSLSPVLRFFFFYVCVFFVELLKRGA